MFSYGDDDINEEIYKINLEEMEELSYREGSNVFLFNTLRK